MATGSILKMLKSGLGKKPMAKRTAAKDTAKTDIANELAALDVEILSLERLLAKTKDAKIKEGIEDKLVKLRFLRRKNEEATTVDENLEAPEELPSFLKYQAGPADPVGPDPEDSIPSSLKIQAY